MKTYYNYITLNFLGGIYEKKQFKDYWNNNMCIYDPWNAGRL